MLTFARKSWDYFQIMLSPYVIHEATSPGMPKTLFPWGLAFSVKKRSLVIHFKGYFVPLFPPYGKYIQRARKLCSQHMLCSVFLLPLFWSQLLPSHLNTMSSLYILVLFFSVYKHKSHRIFPSSMMQKVQDGNCVMKNLQVEKSIHQEPKTSKLRCASEGKPQDTYHTDWKQGRKKRRQTLQTYLNITAIVWANI